MPHTFILSVLSDDHPGIVKTLAETISTNGGNWLESRLAQLEGKFAGVVLVRVGEENSVKLSEALTGLQALGIAVQVEELQGTLRRPSSTLTTFSAAGPDRPGIIRELATAFAQLHINVEELETRCSSMPYTGDPLFEAEGVLLIPEGMPLQQLMDQLDVIADELALDIRLEPTDPNH